MEAGNRRLLAGGEHWREAPPPGEPPDLEAGNRRLLAEGEHWREAPPPGA